MTRSPDVIIVGAGVIGCSAAFHLARRGLAVCVLDKGSIGSGGTGRSSAIIRQHYSNELTARMALHSLAVFREFAERVGGECGFTATGFLALAAAGDSAGLAANVAMHRALGIDTELLGPAELQRLFPVFHSADVAAAAYERGSGYADPHLTVTGFADAARRHGAVFEQHRAVTAVRIAGDVVVGVDTESGPIDAPRVVNCAGPWGARVGRMAGLELPVNSCRVQVAHFVRPGGHEGHHPVVVDFVHGTYLRSETGNLTLAGVIDPAEANAIVDPDAFDEHVDGDFVVHVGERMALRYPALTESRSTGGYSSIYAVTPDWHPIIDEVPSGSGSYVCTGFSGHGFKLAPAVGVMVADMVTASTDPEFDRHAFRASRYAEDDPVKGRYEYSIAG